VLALALAHPAEPVYGPAYAMAGDNSNVANEKGGGQLPDWKCRFCFNPADRTTITSGRFKLCLVCGTGKHRCFGGNVGGGKPEPKPPGVVNSKGRVSWGTNPNKGKGKGKGPTGPYPPPGWGYPSTDVWGHGGWGPNAWGWEGKGPAKGHGKGAWTGGGHGKGGAPPDTGDAAKHVAALQATIKELQAEKEARGGHKGGGPVPSGPVAPAKSLAALQEELAAFETAKGEAGEIQAKKEEIAKAELQGRNAKMAELRKNIKTLREMEGDEFDGLADKKQQELDQLIEAGREAKPLQTRENELKGAIDRKLKAKKAAAEATEEIRERIRKDNEVLQKCLTAELQAEKELVELNEKLAETLRKQAQQASPGDDDMGTSPEVDAKTQAEEALVRIQAGNGTEEDFQKVKAGFKETKKGTGSAGTGHQSPEERTAREQKEAEEAANARAQAEEARAAQEKRDRERAEDDEREKKRAAKVAGLLQTLQAKASEDDKKLLKELEEEGVGRTRSRSRGRSPAKRG